MLIDEEAQNGQKVIADVLERLCAPESYKVLSHRNNHDIPMPSVEVLRAVMDSLRSVLFPGYFGLAELSLEAMPYHVGATLDTLYRQLSEQILRGMWFRENTCREASEGYCTERAHYLTSRFIQTLPDVRHMLSTDVQAAFNGDPAVDNPGEVIFCYPSIRALTNYRVAHELHKLGVPMIPRIITEIAHSETGIDIHPGAQIGEYFFMDHGTGIVIGETSVIGKNVRIYQGVTLGARSFPLDENGFPIKKIPRHPIVEDDVTIYSGATILGRVTIGRGSEIGGNVWLAHSVPPGSRVLQGKPEQTDFAGGEGI
ncbi:MAG TPA: serine acetyltransferase [Deltaproteobacteria bacterium]|jgi:serine O-acetyltransferase|nr:serine acetyltransferase [Deltaproteobacteria bacterium]HOI08413.1 serine acetyltransferase [Deltaproteobacteria bacterium]